ncbi:uncharacterized protein BJ171DRAFT_629634 [Polychytrium aggregatum]|uniref:uncharacterized protein n=1 Tax=Polychytrium aggregatum TaxID=110093 RepID=UPI0022FEAAC6|nr:uncharacterized protein BJ171DRAFT_629634 [Polychytrium aggregatum]KAI9201833.1 hypothetical protein BJ171DRAFT_629634 [Polychytrium aggregatum]
MSEEYKKNVAEPYSQRRDMGTRSALSGGMSMLVSSITGPGVLQIPTVFQTSGFFFPTFLFLVVTVFTGWSCLFLLEAMSLFPGNASFERNVEFTVLVHHFYGRNWYYVMHLVLYGSLQSFNVASIVQAAQAFDTLILNVVGQTCGFQLSAPSGFVCVNQVSNSNSPFGSQLMLLTLGGVLLLAVLIPLLYLDLNDNMIVQWISCLYLIICVLIWVIMSFYSGQPFSSSFSFMAPPGGGYASAIGAVLFNFTLANTIPSWVNVKHKSVSAATSIWLSLWFSTILYIITGWFGALGFQISNGSNLMAAITSTLVTGRWPALVNIINLTYPFLILVTSIPVAFIIAKLNLVTSHLCSPGMFLDEGHQVLTHAMVVHRRVAYFWSTIFPFLVAIPMQTGPWVSIFANWTSLTFQAVCNFIAPLLIYLYLHKRNLVMQQSVLDELDNLDVTANIKKRGYDDEDDDFDYIYHLPYADPARIIRRDPFATPHPAIGAPEINVPSVKCSKSSLQSKDGHTMTKATRRALNLSGNDEHIQVHGRKMSRMSNGSAMHLGSTMMGGSTVGGSRMIGSRMTMGSQASTNFGSAMYMDNRYSSGLGSRLSNGGSSKIYPVDMEDESQILTESGMQISTDIMYNMEPPFKALPPWITTRVPPFIVALVLFVIMSVGCIGILIYNIYSLATGQSGS